MNISSPGTEIAKFMKTINKPDDMTKVANSTLRIAAYAAMFFAAAATVAGSLALGVACPVAGAAALLVGLAVTVLLYDTYQTSKAYDQTLGNSGFSGKFSRATKNATDLFLGKGNSNLTWAEALTQNTLVFKHVTKLASAVAPAA